MFVKVTKNREGTQYVSIVEGYRDKDKVKHRTIKSLGKLKDLEAGNPNYLTELKEDVKAGKYQPEPETLSLTLDLKKKISNPLQNYGWLLVDEIYRSLGIDNVLSRHRKGTKSKIDFNEALRLLTAMRILDPQSKWRSVQSQGVLFGDFNLTPKDVYRSLDTFSLLSEEIQLQIHHSVTSSVGRTGALVFYDVTNYYFETDLDDEPLEMDGESIPAFRKRGPSKEKRPNPIIQMGLFMDTNGIPIAYRLFPGNCVDVKTYLPAVEQIKKQFGIERIVVVADKRMNSKNNISETLQKNDGYLFSQKVRGTRGAPKDIQEFALDPEGWIANEQETFAKKSMIRKRILNKKEITEKILVTWNQKYDFREKVRRKKSVEYAEKLTAGERFRMTMKKGGKRYLEVESLDKETGEIKRLTPHISIDEDQIAFDEQFDGISVLITSETEMSDEEMLTSYRSLSRIEDCFKVMKTTFDARPIYVWTRPHIDAHFLVCFISLTIMRLLEQRLNGQFSPERIQAALQSAQCRPMEQGYWEVFGNDDLLEINEILEKKWNRQYVPLEALKKYGK
ncbi:IS1634 family transposase [Proteiniclasticum sp. SCR006]|uniref:IS1634 family transposase n=1 Tax=Proteiniclasticum aestuarii TaxID=2817862 RepID=A0A939KJQ9_9CLOT|nr:IS1634 family transposase [Proteiniclasticum aestuarii]MBO1265423.1 IS1634 family transposase [Proteiniclasticum aestuarii]